MNTILKLSHHAYTRPKHQASLSAI